MVSSEPTRGRNPVGRPVSARWVVWAPSPGVALASMISAIAPSQTGATAARLPRWREGAWAGSRRSGSSTASPARCTPPSSSSPASPSRTPRPTTSSPSRRCCCGSHWASGCTGGAAAGLPARPLSLGDRRGAPALCQRAAAPHLDDPARLPCHHRRLLRDALCRGYAGTARSGAEGLYGELRPLGDARHHRLPAIARYRGPVLPLRPRLGHLPGSERVRILPDARHAQPHARPADGTRAPSRAGAGLPAGDPGRHLPVLLPAAPGAPPWSRRR